MHYSFFLVTYDITNTKRRNQLHKLLEGYGHAIQKSCFEMYITPRLYKKMLQAIQREIDPQKDSVRVYQISHPDRVKNIGIPIKSDFSNLIII